MKIEVDEIDIQDGVQGDPEFCPIACAIRRIYGPNTEVSVGKHSITVEEDVYLIPVEASVFIAEFDDGEAVEPISFEIKDKFPDEHDM